MTADDFTWTTSSHSSNRNGECVEVGWQKSSYSNGRRSECVEAATGARFAALRDSKYPHRGALSFSSREWQAFVEAVKREQL